MAGIQATAAELGDQALDLFVQLDGFVDYRVLLGLEIRPVPVLDLHGPQAGRANGDQIDLVWNCHCVDRAGNIGEQHPTVIAGQAAEFRNQRFERQPFAVVRKFAAGNVVHTHDDCLARGTFPSHRRRIKDATHPIDAPNITEAGTRCQHSAEQS
jgi:hypothetical protein